MIEDSADNELILSRGDGQPRLTGVPLRAYSQIYSFKVGLVRFLPSVFPRGRKQKFSSKAVAVVSILLAISASAWAQQAAVSIRTLIARSKFEQAERQIQQRLQRNANDAEALNLLGELRREQGKFLDAERMFRGAVAANPKSAAALRNLGRLLTEESRYKEAIAVYEQIPKPSRAARTLSEQANAYARAGEFQRSLEIAHAVPAERRPDALLPVIVADCIGLKRQQEMQTTVGEVLKRAKANPQLVADLAEVLLRNNMVGDAGELLKVAVNNGSTTPAILAAEAQVQARTGHPEEAKGTIRKALAADQKQAEALWVGARIAGGEKDWKTAFQYLKQMWTVTPPRPEMLQALIFAAMQMGDLQTAHDAAFDWQHIEPNSVESTLAMSAVLIQGLHWGEAEQLLKPAMEKYPNDKRIRLALGNAEYNLGKLDEGEKNLRASLGVPSGDADTHYKLGLMAKQQGDLEAATEELEAAVAGDGNNGDALTALGQLYVQANENEKARAVLERAVKVMPANPQSHYQLSIVYRRAKLPDLAQEQLQEFEKLSARETPGPPGELSASPR
jgi:tetratricopeptide (TPR) repeat protein